MLKLLLALEVKLKVKAGVRVTVTIRFTVRFEIRGLVTVRDRLEVRPIKSSWSSISG